MHSRPVDESSRAWRDILNDVRSEMPLLRESFVAQVRELTGYSAASVSSSVVAQDAERSFAYLLDLLSVGESSSNPALGIGTDRARRGIPLPEVLAAIHLDIALLWNVIREKAGSENLELIVDRVADVLKAVEQYSREVQAAYQLEQEQLRHELADERHSLFTRLMRGETTPQLHASLAEAMAITVDQPLAVLTLPARKAEKLRGSQRTIHAEGRRSYFFMHADHAVVVVVLSPGMIPSADDRRRWGRCAHSPVVLGLVDLREAVDLTCALCCSVAGAMPARGVTLRDAWPSALMNESSVMAHAIKRHLVTALVPGAGAHDDDETQRLRETLETYLRYGSVSRTAERLYVHRNTVVNRLARVRELTGLDPNVPRDAACFVVALAI